jgi:hypothetical protein
VCLGRGEGGQRRVLLGLQQAVDDLLQVQRREHPAIQVVPDRPPRPQHHLEQIQRARTLRVHRRAVPGW